MAMTLVVMMMMMKTPSTKRVKVIPIRAKLRDMVIKMVEEVRIMLSW